MNGCADIVSSAALPGSAACCGCGACRAVCPVGAITMKPDKEGFLRPAVDAAKCVNCGKCASVCPVLHPGPKREPLAVYAAKAKDDELRRGSASGGVFTVLAQATLKRGGVVFGAGFDHRDWRVVHKAARNEEELDDLRGSKYVQSDMGDVYVEVKRELDLGREVLFSGCPCQIAALKRYLGREYPNLLTVDLVCHGVPSPLAWRKYLDDREREAKGKISRILARRYCAWREYAISLAFDNASDIAYSEKVEHDPYMQSFMRFWGLRKSCFGCRFRNFASGSDLTLGDYGNIDETHPEFVDGRGISVVMENTAHGAAVYRIAAEEFVSLSMTLADICRINTAIFKSHPQPRFRPIFYPTIVEDGFDAGVKRILDRRQTPLMHHLLWWLKRLVINHELNRIKLR